MEAWQSIRQIGSEGERYRFSVSCVRSFMAFLGTAGLLGCIFSTLGISVGSGVDIVVVLGSVLFTEAMMRTGSHPYCAAAQAGICALFGLIKWRETGRAASLLMERYIHILAGSPAFTEAGNIPADLIEAENGSVSSAELENAAGISWGYAVIAAVLLCLLVWILGQKIRRFVPVLLVTGLFPAMSVAAGVIPDYIYLAMLCLLWAMLLFDADELRGPSLLVVPLVCAVILGILAVVPHAPHVPFDFSRPMGTAAAPTTVGGENHDPVTETDSTGETLPNRDDPEDADPGGESEQKPDRNGENGMGIPKQAARVLIAVLSVMCALLLIPVERQVRLRLRRRKTHSRDLNASAIAEYRYLEQLADYAGTEEDLSGEIWRRATEIGQKARFSGDSISGDELREMHRLSSYYRHICMQRVGRRKRLYGKYYLAL